MRTLRPLRLLGGNRFPREYWTTSPEGSQRGEVPLFPSSLFPLSVLPREFVGRPFAGILAAAVFDMRDLEMLYATNDESLAVNKVRIEQYFGLRSIVAMRKWLKCDCIFFLI